MNTEFKSKDQQSPDQRNIPELKWAERVSQMMDSEFTFPGTKFKFGLDPLLGLIPGIGELSTFLISGILLYTLTKYGASRKAIILMSLNVLLDTTVGSIPVIGNIFDFFYKSNERNVSILKRHYHEGKYQGSGNGIIAGILIFTFVILGLITYGAFKIIQYLFSLI
jgi:hypothetical protein